MTPGSAGRRSPADTISDGRICSPPPARSLGMELAYLAEVRDDELVLREVDGDAAAYGGVAPGFRLPREHSWCHAMVAGDAPQLVTDAARRARRGGASVRDRDRHPRLRRRPGAAAPTGPLYGSLCCLSRAPQPELGRARPALPRRRSRGWPPTGSRSTRARSLGRRAEVEAAAGQALLAALNARENYTAAHSEAVARAGARRRGRARHGRRGAPPPSARSRCCTTSARSACPTRSCASPAG